MPADTTSAAQSTARSAPRTARQQAEATARDARLRCRRVMVEALKRMVGDAPNPLNALAASRGGRPLSRRFIARMETAERQLTISRQRVARALRHEAACASAAGWTSPREEARRARAHRLIELGGLVELAALPVDLTDRDGEGRAVLLGWLLELDEAVARDPPHRIARLAATGRAALTQRARAKDRARRDGPC